MSRSDRREAAVLPTSNSASVRRCFVAQPFTQKYDKRYADTVEPAIRAARFEPYRVDRDPHVQIPIETIEKEIREATACLVEISEDNPNVWFELGLALAARRPTLMVCEQAKRPMLPFDVRHRSVLFYETESPSDFTKLAAQIIERLSALPADVVVSSMLVELNRPAEQVLRAIAEGDALRPDVSASWLMNALSHSAVHGDDVAPAIQRLLALGLVSRRAVSMNHGDEYEYRLSAAGQERVASLPEAADDIPF